MELRTFGDLADNVTIKIKVSCNESSSWLIFFVNKR